MAKWKKPIKIAMALATIHVILTLLQLPVTMHMAQNAGEEICSMARRDELRNFKWTDPLVSTVNASPSLPYPLFEAAPFLKEECNVRVYAPPVRYLLTFGTVYVRIRSSRMSVFLHMHYHALWTPILDLFRSEPYAGRIEIVGFGSIP